MRSDLIATALLAKDAKHRALPLLSEKFFRLQAERKDHAQRVAEAAGSKYAQARGEGFAALSHTCVSCRAAFLEPKVPNAGVKP